MRGIIWLNPKGDPTLFPEPRSALKEPNGLLAAGGDLSQARLLAAYRRGIFPWFSEGEPILWWSPDPRAVLYPKQIRITRSLRKTLKKRSIEVNFDLDFPAVIDACASPRRDARGTWITPELREAYCQLHRDGYAHSVECRQNGELVGGLYGVALGGVFFGESMFSRISDASKIALVHLALQLRRWGFMLIDCQVTTPHLLSMGAVEIPRRKFLQSVSKGIKLAMRPPWQFDADILADAIQSDDPEPNT